MSVTGGPSIVTSGLLLNFEPINTKVYSYAENMVVYSQAINSGNGWSIAPNTTFISSANTAPDGSNTATSFFGNGSGANIYISRAITYAANTSYTASCWARLSNGTVPSNGAILSISYTTNVTGTQARSAVIYSGNLTTEWKRFSTTFFNVAPGTYTAFFVADQTNTSTIEIWGAQIEKNTTMQPYTPTGASAITQSTTARDTISTYAPSLSNTAYYNYNSNGTFTFTRSTAPNLKDGGGLFDGTIRNITASSFIYNNHTWEVWFKIDDRNPGSYDVTEGFSVISVFTGYHQGFTYTSSLMTYSVWDSDGVSFTNHIPCSWTVGTSNAQILQGQWYHLVVTNSNKTFTPYLNGLQTANPTTVTNLRYVATLNGTTLGIGKAYNAAAGVQLYLGYSRYTFGGMKMYNRALSAEEVQQNFNAQRGRYGL